MSKPDPELLARIGRERIERARQMKPIDKLLAGPALFDAFLERHAWGLRHDHPDADDAAIRDMLMKRVRQLQEEGRDDEHP